jgi:hypothetical protein
MIPRTFPRGAREVSVTFPSWISLGRRCKPTRPNRLLGTNSAPTTPRTNKVRGREQGRDIFPGKSSQDLLTSSKVEWSRLPASSVPGVDGVRGHQALHPHQVTGSARVEEFPMRVRHARTHHGRLGPYRTAQTRPRPRWTRSKACHLDFSASAYVLQLTPLGCHFGSDRLTPPTLRLPDRQYSAAYATRWSPVLTRLSTREKK